MGYVLYNLKAGHETTLEDIKKLDAMVGKSLKYIEISSVKNYEVFLSGLGAEDFVILCGGDGTLNRFVNDTANIDYSCEVLYFPVGTGNDFAADLGQSKGCTPFPITDFIQNLPYVLVNGKKYRFLNGIGYGIDGYCCEVGDELKKCSPKKVNYTAIAIKGLLFHYKPTTAEITVDGQKQKFHKVWLAPTMNGRYYGGGMMPTPSQDRRNSEHTLSTMVFHGSGKLKTLMIFPSIFKGEHIKHSDCVTVLTGHEITVEFDRPTALQIDGETILGVTSYTAVAAGKAPGAAVEEAAQALAV